MIKKYFKNYKLISKLGELDEWIKKAEEKGEIAIDTETTSVNPQTANLIGISLCLEPGNACYIPTGHNSKLCFKKNKSLKN